jgi:hypothetical protein
MFSHWTTIDNGQFYFIRVVLINFLSTNLTKIGQIYMRKNKIQSFCRKNDKNFQKKKIDY